jgi:hypothetical protein
MNPDSEELPAILKKIEVGLPDVSTQTPSPKASLQKENGGG